MLASHPSGAHERIGRYEVLRKIATGGMAELFLAKMVGMEGFEKVVAIKRILAHLAYDDEFINMFRDEARIVAKLSHPNIVQIYDLGKSDDTYFIAMEYIPGRNLSSVAKKARGLDQPLPPAYIARCLAQACEGLYYAHTRKDIDGRPLKIVHRDVSPQNIIVSFSGTVKLVDFGIAKAATKIAHTRAGVLKGKYAYMSPEQIRGEETDARSDLFAAGIVLYELLCGRRPFEKENSIQTLKAIVQEQHVDCRRLNPDIPDELAGIIDGALTKDPNERYQNAQELQIALEDFVNGGKERVNNITISKWVTDLFEEELSRERGGTVVFQGVGEVILPDFDPDNPPAAEASDEIAISDAFEADLDASQEIGPLERGRGGGSIDPRPPILAPSNSMLADPEATGEARREMLEEGIIERDDDDEDPWDDDATVHGLDGVPGVPRAETRPERQTVPRYDDDKTEFAPPHVAPPEQTETGERKPSSSEPLLSESETLGPDAFADAVRPPVDDVPADPFAMDVGESLLGPLEDDAGDDAFLADDPWDEATVGYPDGAPPIEQLLHEDAASVDSSEIGPHEIIGDSAPVDLLDRDDAEDMLEGVSDVFDEDPAAWGELSQDVEVDATIAGDPAIWDDETAARDAFVPTGEIPLDDDPVVLSEDSDALDLDLIDAAMPDDAGDTYRGDEEDRHDSTIAVPSVTDEMIRRANEDFGADVTIGGLGGHLDDKTREFDEAEFADPPDREDSGGWSSDATIAGGPSLDELQALHEDEMPDISTETSETVRAMDEEPELPVPYVERDADRTVAGVTSDFMQAGVEVPTGGGYETAEMTEAPNFEDPPTAPPSPRPKRGQEALGAIRLQRIQAEKKKRDDEERTSTGIHPSELQAPIGEPEPSLPELGGIDFEFAIDDDDEAPPVEPSPLDDGDEPAGFSSGPSIAGEEYSKLVAPGVPKSLGSPGGHSRIGSTNVPPSNLSLSQVLANPADQRLSSPNHPVARSSSVPGRSASILGRQIREVVRPGEDAPAAATGSALHFTPKNLSPVQSHPPQRVAPPAPPQQMRDIPAMTPSGPSNKRRALIVALVALAVMLLSGVAYVSIPLLLPGEPVLVLQSTPPGATVFVDGVEQAGRTPLQIHGLKADVAYTVRLELEGYQAVESNNVRLLRTRPLIWNMPLKPLKN